MMEPEIEAIDYSRLFAAAEAVATLVADAAANGQACISVSDSQEGGILAGLSARELDEGVRFLIRLGLIELCD